ncbi:MAG TPA: DNA damage-inducible protein D, partial [Ktedonobacterales bacterium]|nr:DNA damage-inducible protein D [Ktedonobacterales bacterium]
LSPVLGYADWRNFLKVIQAAITACESSNNVVSDHFVEITKMIPLGKGGRRAITDWNLSRYACYLIVQNGDPNKPVIAQGQTYFAIQTRRAELAEQDPLAGLTEDQRRLITRDQLAHQNVSLAATAHNAGVLTPRDFAIFQDHGYRGLYGGETARMIAARKGVQPGTILDHMGSEELAANLFRATQTEAMLQREGITDRSEANATHQQVGAAVRQFITGTLGGTPPEQLPTPPLSIEQLRARERAALDGERQPPLFDE